MMLSSTDPPQDRPEGLRQELSESLLARDPSEHDPEYSGTFALEAALRLSGGGGGWVEIVVDHEPQIRARSALTEEEVHEIRKRIGPSLFRPQGGAIHQPFRWSKFRGLLILPLTAPDIPEGRSVGVIAVLLSGADPPSHQSRQALEHLAATIARQFQRSRQATAALTLISTRLHSYEVLTQRSLAGIFRSTRSGKVLQCNAACARMMGYSSPEEMSSVDCSHFYIHPEEREQLWHELAERGGSALIDAVRMRKDGRPIRLLQDLQLFPDEPDGPPVLHGTLFEITPERPSAEAAEESRALYQKMIEKQCDAIVLVDRDAHILFCGPAVETIFGYRPEELLDRNGFDFVHPEDQLLVRNQLRKLLAGAAVLTAEIRLLHRNGLWRWVEMTASNQLDDPVLHCILLTYRDISERRQQEEALLRNERRNRLIFEASGDVVWDWDIRTNSVRVSGSFQTLFGYRPEEIDANAGWWFLRIHPDDVERISRFFQQAISSGQEFWSDEFRLRQADEGWGFAFARGYILRDRDGAPLRMTGAMTDMTVYHRLHRLMEEGYGNIPIGFLAVNAEGMLVYANPAARQLLGAGDRRLTGINLLLDESLRQFAFVTRIETAMKERTSQHLPEPVTSLQGTLQSDVYPSREGFIVYLQRAAAPAPGAPRRGPRPLQIVAHLPALMSTLMKPFTHRRP